MIRNVLILVYVFAVLFLSVTTEANVTIRSAALNPKFQQISVEGNHNYRGPLEIAPRVIDIQDKKVVIDMEPSCGRNCRPSQEMAFVTVFDVNELGLPADQEFEVFVTDRNSTTFLGNIKTRSNPTQIERELHTGVLMMEGSRAFLQIKTDKIYLSVSEQVKAEQFLNKTVVISGFRNIFDLNETDFYVLSIAETNIL